METVKEAMDAAAAAADWTVTKTKNAMGEATRVAIQSYGVAKTRFQSFVETGVAHHQQTEEMALTRFKDGLVWLRENQTYAMVLAGGTAVVILPRVRRALLRHTLRPFRSDESIYRSAEARLESVQHNFASNQKRTEKLETELTSMLDEYAKALRELKSASQELNSFSNQIHKDILTTQQLMRDMKEMPSRPSLKMQSEAATALSALVRQNRQVDHLLYKVMQKGI